MNYAAQLGMQAAGQIMGAGMGMMIGDWNDERQRKQQEYLQKLQIQGQKDMMDYGYGKQLQMWKDTSYGAQIEQINKAGLNAGLIYGMSGGGGQTTGNASGNVSGATAHQNPGEIQASMAMGMQMAQMAAQTELLKSQANKTNIEAGKIGGVDTANVIADTENKILNKVILDYTGKDAALTFNRIKAPNIAIESETVMKELEARQGIAGTIYEMWVEGKLYEKGIGEIEGILLQNAKTRAEKSEIMLKMDLLEQNIKGAKLGNIITELESKLQTQTGIDRNAPTWLKVIGRLFVELLNK